jgi:hypothetical protein
LEISQMAVCAAHSMSLSGALDPMADRRAAPSWIGFVIELVAAR